MKNIIYLLLALPLLFASCSNDAAIANEEAVEISFCAELPQAMGTRATSTLNVDKVYCAVFENGTEVARLRKEIDIVAGQSISFTPTLIKGRTYDVAFWASKSGAYDMTDMTAISRATGTTLPESDFDAFTAHTTVSVESSKEVSISLTRPFAQLNLGVTPEDWNGVASESTFNMTPTTSSISLTGKSKFNAVTGLAVGEDATITYNLTASGEEFIVNSTYKNIATCYVMIEGGGKQNFNIKFSVYDQNGDVIREDVEITEVPLQANYKTNVLGGLLTGTVTYKITLNEGFNADENNKDIQ